jgi:hypothetical protein
MMRSAATPSAARPASAPSRGTIAPAKKTQAGTTRANSTPANAKHAPRMPRIAARSSSDQAIAMKRTAAARIPTSSTP